MTTPAPELDHPASATPRALGARAKAEGLPLDEATCPYEQGTLAHAEFVEGYEGDEG
jgi:hypothetical protein